MTNKYNKVIHALNECTLCMQAGSVHALEREFNILKKEIEELDKDSKWYFNCYWDDHIKEIEDFLNKKKED